MNRFADILQEANEKLQLPQPTKSRIILEIAADLDDLYRFYKSHGSSDSEAASKATEKFDISNQALEQLAQIHTSPFQRFCDRLSEQGKSKWEQTSLIVLLLVLVVFTGPQLYSTTIFATASKFTWPVVGLSLAGLFISLGKFYQFYLRKDHALRRLRSGLDFLISLTGIMTVVLVCGYVMETYRLIHRMLGDLDSLILYLYEGALTTAAMFVISIIAIILTALAWFILSSKAASIERAEVSFLFTDS